MKIFYLAIISLVSCSPKFHVTKCMQICGDGICNSICYEYDKDAEEKKCAEDCNEEHNNDEGEDMKHNVCMYECVQHPELREVWNPEN